MAKRRADKELNHTNWDAEDSVEEAGVFEKAPDEVLEKRKIRKAKRSINTNDNGTKANAFAGFSFFGNGNAASAVPPAASSPTSNSNTTNGNRTSDEYLNTVAKLNRDILKCISRLLEKEAYLNLTPCFDDYKKHFQRLTHEEEERQRKNNNSASTTAAVATDETAKQKFSFGSSTSPKTSVFGGSSSAVSTFKFDAPTTNVTPKLETKTSSTTAVEASPTPKPFSFSSAAPTEEQSKFTFGQISPPAADGAPKSDSSKTVTFGQPSSGFTFGVNSTSPGSSKTESDSSKNAVFGFRQASSNVSFGVSSFASGTSAPAAANDDEEEAPPKVDVKPVEEEGSLYMKKVKLFYKKKQPDDKGPYADKGVGFLHVKKIDGGHQLLVRAQTTLGNVLLNIRLGKDLPVNRVGNNNVAIMCIPNPPLNPKDKESEPTLFLIRVKTMADADELKDKLIEFKEKS